MAMTLVLILILADLYDLASLVVNIAILSLVAVLLIFTGLRSNATLKTWLSEGKKAHLIQTDRISAMVARVEGAAEGYPFSREELANFLASVLVVRSGKSFEPSHDMVMRTRERLRIMTSGDSKVEEIFKDHPADRAGTFRHKDSQYLSGLESAIRMVRQGE